MFDYLKKKVKGTIFGNDDEVGINKFKDKSVDLRLGGKDWAEFEKDLEEAGIVTLKKGKIKIM
jgi:hypothetical protein